MSERRPRTPRGTPRGSGRPSARPAARATAPPNARATPRASGRARADSGSGQPLAAGAAPAPGRPRNRLTGRAAILILLVAVLTVSYASSMRAYLQQRAHIGDLKVEIAQRAASIDDLEREKKRWQDDAFLTQQARERFGFVFPGETGYQVLDTDGKPLDGDTLHDVRSVITKAPTAWWSTAWSSMEMAGREQASTGTTGSRP